MIDRMGKRKGNKKKGKGGHVAEEEEFVTNRAEQDRIDRIERQRYLAAEKKKMNRLTWMMVVAWILWTWWGQAEKMGRWDVWNNVNDTAESIPTTTGSVNPKL
eukprot:TRINITY_DN4083_c0_g1_i2.p1 TRINITY_DN4083_c0_g1~~TRINITY_DN4083_c0_g1_i2.p1  ORF type:complete len:103 (+),score=23.00 TRINITY_DN4083_c0_g1_i2:189-497(+)